MRTSILGTYEGECADANITNLNGLDITREVWENTFASDEYKKGIEEEWKDIPDFEDCYQCSNFGRVRSKDRFRKQLNRYGKEIIHPYRGKIISLDYSSCSRFGTVHLYDVDRKCELPIYPLVCKLFGQEWADKVLLGQEFISNLEGEIWKDISGYPNYKVSNLGRVRKDMPNYKIILKPWSSEYNIVDLHKDGSSLSVTVHRLVAQAFIPNLENKPQVNHIDGNKLNNKVENLEWVTASENMVHAYRTGLCVPDVKRLKRARKLGQPKVKVSIFVPELNQLFESIRECASKLKIKYDKVHRCSITGNKINGYSFIRGDSIGA